MTEGSMKVGDIVKYQNYGEVRTGQIVRFLGDGDNILIVRKDGPLIGSTTWIHRESVIKIGLE